MGERRPVSKVRVPSAPPYSLRVRKTLGDLSGIIAIWAQFCAFRFQRGQEKMSLSSAPGDIPRLFSVGPKRSPVARFDEANAKRSRIDVVANAI
jgi:hypothetical protein